MNNKLFQTNKDKLYIDTVELKRMAYLSVR